jgi:alkanesulfonate monooxygenase SsuD/methylene tetrahydromethanopterin reductase-like flavin-dependent oxidoreductase (luciferase family)
MKFTFTHPMHSHPYNAELVTGSGVATVAAAAEAAGFHGFGFTDHPAPTQKWLESGGHDAVDPFVAMGFAAARTTTLRYCRTGIRSWWPSPARRWICCRRVGSRSRLASDI